MEICFETMNMHVHLSRLQNMIKQMLVVTIFTEKNKSAAELWLAKVCLERQIVPFLKSIKLGQKLGFSPIALATDMLASQSRAL